MGENFDYFQIRCFPCVIFILWHNFLFNKNLAKIYERTRNHGQILRAFISLRGAGFCLRHLPLLLGKEAEDGKQDHRRRVRTYKGRRKHIYAPGVQGAGHVRPGGGHPDTASPSLAYLERR